jgi:hypothetical protein
MDNRAADASNFFVDVGWGDWRLAGSPETRVTAEQVAVISSLGGVEDLGAAEHRFGEMIGELVVFHADGQVTEVAEDGTAEAFTAR